MNVKDYLFTNTDFVQIKNLEVLCRVGCSAEERSFPQILTITTTAFLSLKKSAQEDDLRYTVDYAATAEQIKKILLSKDFCLIETIAESIADYLLDNKIILGVNVEVSKKVIPGMDAAVVSICRMK